MAQVMTRGKVKSKLIIKLFLLMGNPQPSTIFWYAVHRLDVGWHIYICLRYSQAPFEKMQENFYDFSVKWIVLNYLGRKPCWVYLLYYYFRISILFLILF